MYDCIDSVQVAERMHTFDISRSTMPLFNAIGEYMNMVSHMLTYIRAVRTGDWKMHLEATETFIKYHFA